MLKIFLINGCGQCCMWFLTFHFLLRFIRSFFLFSCICFCVCVFFFLLFSSDKTFSIFNGYPLWPYLMLRLRISKQCLYFYYFTHVSCRILYHNVWKKNKGKKKTTAMCLHPHPTVWGPHPYIPTHTLTTTFTFLDHVCKNFVKWMHFSSI